MDGYSFHNALANTVAKPNQVGSPSGMREAHFTSEIMSSISAHGGWAYKLSDQPTSWTQDKTRFTPTKPCDIVASFGGRFVAIETKQMKVFKAFGLRDMRPSQIESLSAVIASGGRSFVFLNVRIEPNQYENQKRENRLIVFDWKELFVRLSQSSIKAREIKELPFTGKTPTRKDINGKSVKGVFDFSHFDTLMRNDISINDF